MDASGVHEKEGATLTPSLVLGHIYGGRMSSRDRSLLSYRCFYANNGDDLKEISGSLRSYADGLKNNTIGVKRVLEKGVYFHKY